MPTKDYEIPRFGTPAPNLLGWLLEAQQEGAAWLQAQRPAQEWENALLALSGPDGAAVAPDGLSNLGYNKTKRVARELVASLANFRHEGEFKVTHDQKLYDQAHALTHLDQNWYQTTIANDAHRGALQFGIATGTSYLWQTWDKNYWSPYRGDIRLTAIGPADVTFIQLPKSNDIQRAYGVLIREELPINLARAMYMSQNPEFARGLVPDRDAPGWLSRGLQKLQQFMSPALRVAGKTQQGGTGSFPTVDIFHLYTLDSSINELSTPLQMGPPGVNWSYKVWAKDDPIPTNIINPATGNYFTRPADWEDCRLFPLRRYTIFSRTGVCYDGSSPYWHAEAPIVRLRFGDWAWEALGTSQIADLKTIQDGIVALMRGIEDSAAARLDPPAVYDENMVSKSWADAFNPRRAGSRAAANLNLGDPIKYPIPPEYYNVPQWITEWISQQEGRMDYLSGVTDLVAIAKAKQVPGADTLEKLMEMAGPIVQDLVRQIEHPLQRLGEQRKSMYFQFYTRARMLRINGPDGIAIDKQYLPEQLVPLQPNESAEARSQRVRGYLDDFQYVVTESGINEIHRMTNKLFYLQLMKIGFPISWWTMAKVCQIPNFGPEPVGTNTELERWQAQQRITMEQQAEMAVLAAQAQMIIAGSGMAGGGMGAPGDPAGGGGAPAGGGGAPGGNGDGPGRPPSFQKPPKLEQKDGGTRSTVTTS